MFFLHVELLGYWKLSCHYSDYTI